MPALDLTHAAPAIYMAMVIGAARAIEGAPLRAAQSAADPSDLQHEFMAAAKAAGWRVLSDTPDRKGRGDVRLSRGRRRYLVEFKGASEGDAIACFRSCPKPFSRRAPLRRLIRVDRALWPSWRRQRFRNSSQGPSESSQVLTHPTYRLGIVDREGLRVFVGPALESLNAPAKRESASGADPGIELFSDWSSRQTAA